MKKITIPVAGMHCRSCEVLLEKSIKKIKNVESVEANERKGLVEIYYKETRPDMESIETIVSDNGYTIGKVKKLPWISMNVDDYINVFIASVIIFILYIFASTSGWSFGNVGNTSSPTMGVALLIGLTAGVSSCMALIGGLVLGISAKWNKDHENASVWTRFTPHIYFHLGRVLGFGLLGGLLGLFGSIVHFSNLFLGIMTALVGVIMLILGLNLTNISPRVGSFSPTLPKFLGKNVNGDEGTKKSAIITGAATFFLPCGFTLAMQMYAMSTGSFMTGALVLAFFAIGTIPGLLSIGIVTAILKGEWLKKFLAFTGVIVLGLAAFNITNGYTLLSLGLPTDIKQGVDTGNLEVQEVRMTQDDNGYSPSTLTIDAGKKIRWIITSKSPFACSSQIVAPQLGVNEKLKQGENIIEFVAPVSGEIPFSCSMGMYRGKFVVNTNGKQASANNSDTAYASDQPQPTQQAPAVKSSGGCGMMGGGNGGGCGGGSGGGCAMMGGNTKTPTATVNADPVVANTDSATPQVINLEYTSAGLSGNINVKKGKSYKIVINVKDTISGCMHMILIPGMDENAQPLDAGNVVTFNITPKQTGKFPLTCAMGVPHGYITVE